MVRIISGKFKGKKLAKSSHLQNLRPTTDFNRENIFNLLQSNSKIAKTNFDIVNSSILDLCCGTGAFAFEALSRGVKYALLIDNDQEHIKIAKQSKNLLKLEFGCDIMQIDIMKLSQNNKYFDLIFLDPPYKADYFAIINELINKNWLQKNAIFIVEMGIKENDTKNFEDKLKIGILSKKLEILEKRKYGNVIFYFFFIN